MRALLKTFCSIAVLILALPAHVFACACCSDSGAYRISFQPPADYEIALMEEMRLSKTANLYETNADIEEDALGLGSLRGLYSASGSMTNKMWKLTLRNGTKSGTLSLPLPDKMLRFVADIRDGKISAGGGPLLYKEWRFEGRLTGTGFFKVGNVGPDKYFFVLQGRGNNCDNSQDFQHWRLEISGNGSRYAFYGKLARPVP